MALFAACFGRKPGRLSARGLATGGLSEAVIPLADQNVLAPSPQNPVLPRLESRDDKPNSPDTCAPSDLSAMKFMELRDAMIMAISPAIITVVTYKQSVIYQNPQSKAYLGDRVTSAEVDVLGDVLNIIFAYEPEKFRRMLDELCREGSPGVWKAVVRVPHSLNNRTQYDGIRNPAGSSRVGLGAGGSGLRKMEDFLGRSQHVGGEEPPPADATIPNGTETAAGPAARVAVCAPKSVGLGRTSGGGGAPADAGATNTHGSSWIVTTNDSGNCERLSLPAADVTDNEPTMPRTSVSAAVASVAAPGSWGHECTDMGIVPWSTEVGERTSRADVGGASGGMASFTALQFPRSRTSAVTRSSLPAAAAAAFIGGSTVTPAELMLTGTDHTDCTGRFSGSFLSVHDPLATSTFATFANVQSSFNEAPPKEASAASGRGPSRAVSPLPALQLPSTSAKPGPAATRGVATNSGRRPPPRRTISYSAPAFNRALGAASPLNVSCATQGGLPSLHSAGSRALAFAMSLGTSPLVASVCLNSGGGGGVGSSAASSPRVRTAPSTCRAKTTEAASYGRSGAAATVPRIAAAANGAAHARVAVLLQRAPHTTTPTTDAGFPPARVLKPPAPVGALGPTTVHNEPLGQDRDVRSGEGGGGVPNGSDDGLDVNEGGGGGGGLRGGDLGAHAAGTPGSRGPSTDMSLEAVRFDQAVRPHGCEASGASHSDAQGNLTSTEIQPQFQPEPDSKSGSSTKSETKIATGVVVGMLWRCGDGALTALPAAASTSMLTATKSPKPGVTTKGRSSPEDPSSPPENLSPESLVAALQARLARAAPAKGKSLPLSSGERRAPRGPERAHVYNGGSPPSAQSATTPSPPPHQHQQQLQPHELEPQQVHGQPGGDNSQLQPHVAQPERHQEPQRARLPPGPECWHEVWATKAQDPITGTDVIVLTQTDVTAKVIAERHLALVMETEHRLVEQLFPRHILQYITEEWTAAHQLAEGQAAEAGAGAGGGGGEGYMPGSGGGRGPGCAAGESLRWRPVVRDCNALATWHPQVTLLFADIKGFTPMCKEVEPRQVMSLLNSLYSRYDAMLDKYGVYKVETIGDCYFVAGGLIHEDEDGMVAVREGSNTEDPLHAEKIFMFAKAMLSAAREVVMPTTGEPVQIRIGLHTGPVVSGVVGTRMPRFCLFGDTVNTASRMESTGLPGAIHASEATYNRLPRSGQWEPTGGIEVKGKGLMQTYIWQPRDPDGRQPSSIPSWWHDCRLSGTGGGSCGGGACTAHPPLVSELRPSSGNAGGQKALLGPPLNTQNTMALESDASRLGGRLYSFGGFQPQSAGETLLPFPPPPSSTTSASTAIAAIPSLPPPVVSPTPPAKSTTTTIQPPTTNSKTPILC